MSSARGSETARAKFEALYITNHHKRTENGEDEDAKDNKKSDKKKVYFQRSSDKTIGNALMHQLEESVAHLDSAFTKDQISSEDENTSPAAAKKYADKLKEFEENDEERIDELIENEMEEEESYEGDQFEESPDKIDQMSPTKTN